MYADSPTSRALLVLELIQNHPGITAAQLADRFGVTDRAVRRYVAILREADIAIESTTGRYGGYRVGRGVRIPPLTFSPEEALGLVMAAVEGRGSTDTTEPVGSALAKILRVLPERVAGPARAVGSVASPGRQPDACTPDPRLLADLVAARGASHRVSLEYRTGSGRETTFEVDPWAVVVRHGLWYLLCWSHTAEDRRSLRIDRVLAVCELTDTFTAPAGLDPVRTLEEQLSQGWTYDIEIVVDASLSDVRRWVPRSVARLEVIDDGRTRLVASTDEPDWYAAMLAFVKAPMHVVRPPELRAELAALGLRLAAAGQASSPRNRKGTR